VTRFTTNSTAYGSGTNSLLFPEVASTVPSQFLTRYTHTDGTETSIFRLGGSSGLSQINGWGHKLADGTLDFSVSDFAINSIATFEAALSAIDPTAMQALLFSGADSITGGAADNVLAGLTGDDTISGLGGADTIDGGAGRSYLRGDDGDDKITGGADFDDINGNVGDDTAFGGLGDDWVVGGKDQDSLSGGAGADLVYGNLGDDVCEGGDGNDIVRGGQQSDVLFGGAGDDWLSGDRDSDTMTGGAGADTFHSFAEAGVDRVTDFNRAEGDRVLLDAGTTYTVLEESGDVIVLMNVGGQLVLAGVSLSSLTGDWITVG
jgi:serralysin